MRILITVNHPAHVHFFRLIFDEIKSIGHEATILATDKENSFKLLDQMDIEYVSIGKHKPSPLTKILNIPFRWIRIFYLCLKHKPDIAIGIADFYIAQISKILRFSSIVLTDTEHVRHDKYLTFPFADYVLTPKCFSKKIGENHISYDGYHEMTYLGPEFTPNREILDLCKIKEGERFVLIRLVAWNAAHDIGYSGLSEDELNKIIMFLEVNHKVLISSEKKLPHHLDRYKIDIPFKDIHHLLYFSEMYIGEGATMASEAALLGTPAIYLNELKVGYLDELSKEFKIVFIPKTIDEVLSSINEISTNGRNYYRSIRNNILSSKTNPNKFIISFIERLKDRKCS